jgi:hypothetical protein
MTDNAEIGRWRQTFELTDGALHWRADPARGAAWNAAWAGKPTGERVRIDGRKPKAWRVAEALATGAPRARTSVAGRRSTGR